ENLRGSEFADSLTGNDLDNDLQGGEGNDTLVGGGGEDLLAGGGGDDRIDGGAQPVEVGRTFFDTADFSSAEVAMTIVLGGGNGTATGQGSDVLIGIEGARGGSDNDT